MNKAGRNMPVVVGVVLSLIGGLAGAAVAVGLVHAAWSPFHAAAIQTASDASERERASQAEELGGLAHQREQAVAVVAAAPEFAKAENDLLKAVLDVEAARDAAVALAEKENAELTRVASERDELEARLLSERERAAVSLAEVSSAKEQEPTSREDEETRRLLERLPRTMTNSIGMKFVLIRPGTFVMGSAVDEAQADTGERPAHQATLSRPYYLGIHEVTNANGIAVKGFVPSRYTDPDLPVQSLTWVEAMAFCDELSALPEERKARRVYRLPTEAEWEYACRAGTATMYSFGDDASLLGDFAWFKDNAGSRPRPVGQKRPNPWGLYDMHGNVWEWCSDWNGTYDSEAVRDPQGPAEGSDRVLRGGCWRNPARYCRSAARDRLAPSLRNDFIGFRLALSPSGVSPPEAGE